MRAFVCRSRSNRSRPAQAPTFNGIRVLAQTHSLARPVTLSLAVSVALSVALSVTLAMALSASVSFARPPGPPPGGPPGGGGRGLERALESVELPGDVRADVDELLDASHRTRRSLQRSLRTAHDEMRALLGAESPNEEAILQQADKIGTLQTALEKDRLSTLLRVRERLTPAQRDAMTRALQAHRPPRGPGHPRPRGPGGPGGRGPERGRGEGPPEGPR